MDSIQPNGPGSEADTVCRRRRRLGVLLESEIDLLTERNDLADEIATRVEQLRVNTALLRATRRAIAEIVAGAA